MQNETLNKTYTQQPDTGNGEIPNNITMLAVPKAWTRLVVALCILLFTVVGLVSLMVYVQYKTSQRNTDRILEMQHELDELKSRIPEDNK